MRSIRVEICEDLSAWLCKPLEPSCGCRGGRRLWLLWLCIYRRSGLSYRKSRPRRMFERMRGRIHGSRAFGRNELGFEKKAPLFCAAQRWTGSGVKKGRKEGGRSWKSSLLTVLYALTQVWQGPRLPTIAFFGPRTWPAPLAGARCQHMQSKLHLDPPESALIHPFGMLEDTCVTNLIGYNISRGSRADAVKR